MRDRERLVESIGQCCAKNLNLTNLLEFEKLILADHILADGWVRPPCKVGSKVYIVAEITQKIIECTVIGYWMCEGACSVITDHGTIYGLSFDKTVFTDREDAEKALKGGGQE